MYSLYPSDSYIYLIVNTTEPSGNYVSVILPSFDRIIKSSTPSPESALPRPIIVCYLAFSLSLLIFTVANYGDLTCTVFLSADRNIWVPSWWAHVMDLSVLYIIFVKSFRIITFDWVSGSNTSLVYTYPSSYCKPSFSRLARCNPLLFVEIHTLSFDRREMLPSGRSSSMVLSDIYLITEPIPVITLFISVGELLNELKSFKRLGFYIYYSFYWSISPLARNLTTKPS